MISCGVSENTLKSVKSKGISCWTFIQDPSDRRRVLIQYNSLKDKYKDLVIAKYGDPYTYMADSNIKQYLNSDANARLFFENYRLADGKGLPENTKIAYVKASEWLNMLLDVSQTKQKLNRIGLNKSKFWETACKIIQAEGIQLPTAYTRLLNKMNEYKATGYSVLVSKKFSNTNSEKISHAAGDWLIAQYSMPTVSYAILFLQYNKAASENGWKILKSQRSLEIYLNLPEVKAQWYGARHGFRKANTKYAYKMHTIKPTMRDTIWNGDGTKLNYYYLDEKNKMKADCTVYEVIDEYSEVLLGYSIGKSEDFIIQYHAYKMAMQFSGHQPFQIKYDGQGGHKKLQTEGFMTKISRVGFKSQPYSPQSKKIESIFGRFQNQYLKRDWFYTGANITAKKTDSRANIEFILKNKSKLPDYNQICTVYKARRDEWNNAPHPHIAGKTRLQVYNESVNPETPVIDMLQMVEMFWMTNPKEVTYYTSGLTMTVANKKYEYEVLTEDNQPDIEFRRKYIDAKFVVKYDPADMTHVRLYQNSSAGLQFVNIAQPVLRVPGAVQDYKPGSRSEIDQLIAFANDEKEWMKKQHIERQDRTGISIENQIQDSLAMAYKNESYFDPNTSTDDENAEINLEDYL